MEELSKAAGYRVRSSAKVVAGQFGVNKLCFPINQAFHRQYEFNRSI